MIALKPFKALLWAKALILVAVFFVLILFIYMIQLHLPQQVVQLQPVVQLPQQPLLSGMNHFM